MLQFQIPLTKFRITLWADPIFWYLFPSIKRTRSHRRRYFRLTWLCFDLERRTNKW